MFLIFLLNFKPLLSNILTVKLNQSNQIGVANTFFTSLGISHCLSCPHTLQQNGAVERKHCHIVGIGLTLLATASVPFSY